MVGRVGLGVVFGCGQQSVACDRLQGSGCKVTTFKYRSSTRNTSPQLLLQSRNIQVQKLYAKYVPAAPAKYVPAALAAKSKLLSTTFAKYGSAAPAARSESKYRVKQVQSEMHRCIYRESRQ